MGWPVDLHFLRVHVSNVWDRHLYRDGTPTVLDSFGLRLGWAVALALVFIGVTIILITFGQAGRRVHDTPLFSREMYSFLHKRWWTVVFLFIGATLLRALWLRDSIADAVGIIERESDRVSNVWSVEP